MRLKPRCIQVGHSYTHNSACCDVTRREQRPDPRGKMPRGGEGRYKKSPDLAEPPKAADVDCNNALCRYSIIWPPYFNVWSTLTLSRPCQGSQAPGPWTGNVPSTTIPTVASSQVSVTKSLMSHIMYAAPVTSNVIHWDAHHSHPEEKSLHLVWSCSAQSFSYSRFTLFVFAEHGSRKVVFVLKSREVWYPDESENICWLKIFVDLKKHSLKEMSFIKIHELDLLIRP